MTRPTILVTGAAGRTGGAVVRELLARGQTVRATVRREDRRSDELRRAGADVVVTDLFDPASIRNSLRGVQRAYVVPPWHPHMLESAAAFAAALDDSSVEHIVWMSQWLADPSHPSPATRQHAHIDRLMWAVPGVARTMVHPGYFADNYLRVVDFAALLGRFPSPTGESRNAPPSNEDIARVVVGALLDPQRHDGRTYRPTGPALLSAGDMAQRIGKVLDREVRHWDLPLPMFLKATRVYGVDPIERLNVVHYLEEHRRGTFELGAPTDDVATVTGRPAEPFEVVAERYASLPFARRTRTNRARMLARVARIGVTPTPDVDRFARRLGLPVLSDPVFAIDSASWRASHIPLGGAPDLRTEMAS